MGVWVISGNFPLSAGVLTAIVVFCHCLAMFGSAGHFGWPRRGEAAGYAAAWLILVAVVAATFAAVGIVGRSQALEAAIRIW